MRATTGREEIVDRLFELFRQGGFEGVSLADIGRATGLNKSSLYHHFPGGKADMAAAVIERARVWVGAEVVEPLRQPSPRDARVDAMLEAVEALYQGGRRPCLIASMLVGPPGTGLAAAVGAIVRDWLDALTAALVETGAEPAAAGRAATDALARLQGALVLARALDDKAPFEAALAAVRRDLLAA